MEILHVMPAWFLSTNILFELLFFIFAAAIAFYSLRIYRITRQRESRIFGLAFLSIALSRLALFLVNAFFLTLTKGGLRVLEFEDIMSIKDIAVTAYVSLFIIGLITLVYLSLKIKNPKYYLLLILLSAIALVSGLNKSFLIYSLAFIFLVIISFNYINEFLKTKNKNTFLVALGFILLAISSLLLVIVADYLMPRVYVAAYLLEVLGYVSIFSSLISILKNGKKTKSARSH